MLSLSLYVKAHRQTYYELLKRVRAEGDCEARLDFFAEVGVKWECPLPNHRFA
jgi:hypothetical protein